MKIFGLLIVISFAISFSNSSKKVLMEIRTDGALNPPGEGLAHFLKKEIENSPFELYTGNGDYGGIRVYLSSGPSEADSSFSINTIYSVVITLHSPKSGDVYFDNLIGYFEVARVKDCAHDIISRIAEKFNEKK